MEVATVLSTRYLLSRNKFGTASIYCILDVTDLMASAGVQFSSNDSVQLYPKLMLPIRVESFLVV